MNILPQLQTGSILEVYDPLGIYQPIDWYRLGQSYLFSRVSNGWGGIVKAGHALNVIHRFRVRRNSAIAQYRVFTRVIRRNRKRHVVIEQVQKVSQVGDTTFDI